MKRMIALLLTLVLVCGLCPAAMAASAPAVSSNINDHWYINVQRWTDPIYSNLAYENGEYIRAECIGENLVVEHYDQNFKFLSGTEIALELPIYGGVYMASDYNFLVVGQENWEEDDTVEVFRIIRYTKDWEKVDHASIYGANTVDPFQAGSLRFDRCGDMLYIRTAHKMYADENGTNHQANVMIALRISDMTVTDQLTKVWNSGYGYVSHSFNQFVRVDGETLLAVDHGDALPRSVCLFKYPYSASSETFYGRTTMVNVLNIVDSTYHYNDTGVSVGGFEFSSTDYLVAGCAYDQSESVDLRYVHRNIFVTATPKDDFTDEATEIHWLTSYTAADSVEVSPPHLLKVSADRFFLTWTENDTLKYAFLDGQGNLDGTIQTGSGDLSDCEPIRAGRYAVWYVTNNSAPVFYKIELEECTHSYTAAVTAPTCTAGGYTIYTCEYCGDSYTEGYTAALGHDETAVVTEATCTSGGYTTYTCTRCGAERTDGHTDALGHDWGEWTVTEAPTCTEPGSRRRGCTRCDAAETETLAATGHSYTSIVTDPTCTEQGYTTYICENCGDSRVDHYTAALGHTWDEGEVITEPTEEENGLRRYTCTVCGDTEDRVIPALNHEHSYESVVTAPTCTEQGYTTHTCAGCGDSYVDGYTAALGHDWKGLACRRCDAVRQNPFTDTDPEGFYFDAVLWAVENGITNGTTPTTFDPNGQCQRAQVVTFLWRAAGKPEPTTDTNPFVDVMEDDFFYKAVLWAVEKGITNGLDADHFGPYAYCNRAQVVTFLYRTMGQPEVGTTRCAFTDVEAGAWYEKPILWAVENGVTNGLSATEFGINAICNRAQIVTFLYRTFA